MAIKKINKETSGQAKIYISASFNNTLVNICDERGGTIAWGSSGAAGFKGTRRSTPFAATTAVENALEKLRKADVNVVTTNTIPNKVAKIDVSGLIAGALK